MAETLVTVTGTTVTHDETAGRQDGATPTDADRGVGANPDNDDVLFSSIPGVFSTRLGQLTTATAIGAAESDGNVVTFSPTGTLGNIALTDASGLPLDGDDSGLDTADGQDILLYTDTNDNIVLGRAADDGAIVFAIYLEETGGSPPTGAKIWTVQYEAIDHGADLNDYDSAVDLTNKVFVTAFEANTFDFANAPPGDNLFMAFGDTSQAIVVSGRDPANQSAGENLPDGDTVNTAGQAATSLGTNGQQVRAGEGMYFTFVTGMDGDFIAGPGQNLTQNEADVEANIAFTGLFPAMGGEFLISQVNPGNSSTEVSIKITAYDADLEAGVDFVDGLNDDSTVAITDVTINGVSVFSDSSIVTVVGDSVIVSGVQDGDELGYTTSSNHTRVLIENAQPTSGKGKNITFDLGGFTLTQVAGDTDEVGSKVFFEDDGPTAAVAADGTEPGTVYLFDGNTTASGNFEGNNGTGLPTDDAAADQSPTSVDVEFAPAFTMSGSAGADGGSVVSSYSLVLAASVGDQVVFSGSGATSGGTNVVWSEITAGSVYAGVAGGTEIFRLSVDGDGTVTFQLSGVLDHGTDDSGPFSTDILTLDDGQISIQKSVTSTDSEGDTATASASVDLGGNFAVGDDGPTAAVAADGTEPGTVYLFDGNTTASGNFEGNNGTGLPTDDAAADQSPTSVDVEFAPAFTMSGSAGADGGSVVNSYSLVLAASVGDQVVFSGSDATSGGLDVEWKEVTAGSVYAGVVNLGMGSEAEIFRLSVDGDGTVTFQQSGVLDHSDTDSSGPYSTDILILDDGQISVQRSVTSTDSEGDIATASASVDLGGNFAVGDDGPAVTVEDLMGSFVTTVQSSTWSDDPGADGFKSLNINLDSYQIDANSVVDIDDDLGTLLMPDGMGNFVYMGSIMDDFTDDGMDNEQTVNFTLTFKSDGSYDFQLTTPPSSVVEISSADGSLDAGGPDPVRTLTVDSSDIVFSAVEPTTAPAAIVPFLDAGEAFIEANAGFLSTDEMNVSTAGIGNDNNNFNGNADPGVDGNTTNGGKVDESFVVDPDSDISSMKVFIDNSVSGYNTSTEELYYRVYYNDGTFDAMPTLVEAGDLTAEAGRQVSFVVGDPTGESNIDAVQLFMGTGTVKIPVIEFTITEEFDPEPLDMDFTATLVDDDDDSSTDTFSIDLDPVVA